MTSVDSTATGETGPIEAVRGLLETAGIAGRRLRTVILLLTESRHTLASLVQTTGVERRAVESILNALGPDLDVDGRWLRIAVPRADSYRDLIDGRQLLDTQLVDPLERRMATSGSLVAQMGRWIVEAPGRRQGLDHVSATAETAVRRALWLDSTFDLNGARLLCIGDHDLTSLAVAEVNPGVAVTVVDVDDKILEFIDSRAHRSIRCLWADFRFGLADGANEWGDLVFTDPPYTPEGVRLFLARGLEGLRDREHARLVMAYGFGENHPTLGLKVQQAVGGLHLAYEAVLPGFNRYHGAEAIGSSSDLYVLRPTARSGRPTHPGGSKSSANIYTRGAQSLEGESARLAADITDAVRAAAAGPANLSLAAFIGDGWSPNLGADAISLQAMFAGELPAELSRRAAAAAVDLTADPGSWLVRVLLATDAQRLAILVPNNHPDLANEAAQRNLRELLAAKYRLRLRRSTPGPRYAIVEADRVDVADLDPPQRAVRAVVDRAHGKVGNTWREALIRAGGKGETTLTKNDARTRIRTAATAPDLLDDQLVSLPRHHIEELVVDIAASVEALAGRAGASR